jgi:hypothetical protein
MNDVDTIKIWNERKDFANERELEDFVFDNSAFWVKDFYGRDKCKITRQGYFGNIKFFGANKPRIDLYLELDTGKRIGIEIKNPNQLYSELSQSISQLLSYSVIADETGNSFDELAIITSKFDPILTKVIKKFNLPIRVFIVNKVIHCEII